MTVPKTQEDLDAAREVKAGPKLINVEGSDPTVKALKAQYPNAKNIEKLPTGLYAVRFHKKRAKYLTAKKR